MKRKLFLSVVLLFLTVSLTGCMSIGGKKMELTKEEQNIIALQIYNTHKGIREIKFTDYRIVGFTAPRLDLELNGNPEDSSIYDVDPEYFAPGKETSRYRLNPIEWNEETQTYWFRGKYERYDETNSPGERNSSKIKITYLDGSTNR